MHLFYYDEVKYDPPNQKSFWLGGICASSDIIPSIEAKLNAVAQDVFGSSTLVKETEFHGIELCRGKGNFKHIPFEKRLEFLRRILAIAATKDVYRGYIRIIPENVSYTADSPDEIAFMYLVEKTDQLFKDLGTYGMIFGDYDEPNIGSSVASLSQYRKNGTKWSQKKDIQNIIDTVHFARSHHSRMIQLSDVFLYCLQFSYQKNQTYWRREIATAFNESGILSCRFSKHWPSTPCWYR